MRKLDITDYTCDLRNEQGDSEEVPYHVKDSLAELILARDLQLNGRALLEHHKLAQKILDCKDGQLLLEDEEYAKLERAVNVVKGLGRTDVELVRRIFEAEKVEVEEIRK